MSNRSLLLVLAVLVALASAAAFVLLRSDPPDPPVVPAEVRRDAPRPPAPTLEPVAEPAIEPDPADDVEPEPAPERQEVSSARARELEEARWIRGLVLFPDGTPTDEPAHTRVVARGGDFEHGPDHDAAVEADGTFRVAFAPDTERGSIELEARFVHLPEPVVVGLADEVVLEPQLGGHLHGSLDVPADSPLPRERLRGARVRLLPDDAARTVGDDFTFDFGGRAPRRDYRLEIRAPGFEPLNWVRIRLDRLQDKHIPLVVEPGLRVSGVVVAPDGSPVPDAEVEVATVLNIPERGALLREASTRTGDDGTFRVDQIAPGTLHVKARAQGLLTTALSLGEHDRGARVEDVRIVMRPGSTIAGRVQWADGTPAAGAQVTVFDHRSPIEREVTSWPTDERGAFEATGLGRGPFRLEAVAARDRDGTRDTRRAVRTDVDAGTRELHVTLPGGSTVDGVLTDELGTPIERFTVEARPTDEPDEDPPLFLGDLGQLQPTSPATVSCRVEDPDGTFRIELPDGEWELVAVASGRTSEAVTVAAPTTRRAVLELPRTATLVCTVRTDTGRPIPGASVLVDREASGTTDDSGTLVLEGLEPGYHWLSAEPPATASRAPSEEDYLELAPGTTTTAELVLPTEGTLTCILRRANGSPLVRRLVQVEQRRGTHESEHETDADGRIVVGGLEAGAYEITAEPSRAEVRAFEERHGEFDDDILEWRTTVEVGVGERVEVVLDAPRLDPVRLSGRVRLDGEAVRRGSVFFVAPGPDGRRDYLLVDTDAEGDYEVLLPRPGRHEVSIEWRTPDGWREAELEIEVPDVESWTLDVEGSEQDT